LKFAFSAEANFLELIASCIRSDTTSSAAEYTFRSILNYGDTAAAVKLVREHNIDISNTPEYIRSVVERGLEAESDGSRQPATGYWEDENWETGETIVRQCKARGCFLIKEQFNILYIQYF